MLKVSFPWPFAAARCPSCEGPSGGITRPVSSHRGAGTECSCSGRCLPMLALRGPRRCRSCAVAPHRHMRCHVVAEVWQTGQSCATSSVRPLRRSGQGSATTQHRHRHRCSAAVGALSTKRRRVFTSRYGTSTGTFLALCLHVRIMWARHVLRTQWSRSSGTLPRNETLSADNDHEGRRAGLPSHGVEDRPDLVQPAQAVVFTVNLMSMDQDDSVL